MFSGDDEMFDLRPATESDLPFLIWLREQTMLDYLEKAGIELDADAQLARITYRFDCAQIISVEGRAVGLLKVARETDIWELIQIQLSPELQGKGVGKALVQQLLADAKQVGVGVKLSVLKTNPARSLYERLGFKIVSEDSVEYLMRFFS